MNQCFRQKAFRTRGLNLSEVLISLGVFGVVSTVLFSVLQAGSVLLAKGTGINVTHGQARMGSERLLNLIQSSVASPILVDSSLTPVSGNGPAAGITFLRLASGSTYSNKDDATATATTLVLKRSGGMPAPQTGDVLVMLGTDNATFLTTNIIGFQASITGVSAVSTNEFTINFGSTIGSFCNPVATTGTVLPKDAKFFMLDKMACVASGTELRLLNNASDSSTYEVLATLVAKTGETQLLPFKYDTTATPDRRWVDVDLRVESTTYNKRKLGTTNTFFDLKESIAYRSAVLVQN